MLVASFLSRIALSITLRIMTRGEITQKKAPLKAGLNIKHLRIRKSAHRPMYLYVRT